MKYAEVISTEMLTPHLARVVLGGDGLADYTPTGASDEYVNCFFVPPEAPYRVPFSKDEVQDLPAEQRPFPRRITVRSWDPERRHLTLDIAVHGEVGYAGRWALHAQPGDLLQFKGPAGDYSPPAEADAYLFVGDESALPAIAACAEAVPAGRPVTVVAEVDDSADEIELTSPGDLTVRWVHRSKHTAWDSLLADAVAEVLRPEGPVSAFVHGEAEEIREVRRVLLEQGYVTQDSLSFSPYWRRGMTDEEWRKVKGDWVREVNAETFATA